MVMVQLCLERALFASCCTIIPELSGLKSPQLAEITCNPYINLIPESFRRTKPYIDLDWYRSWDLILPMGLIN